MIYNHASVNRYGKRDELPNGCEYQGVLRNDSSCSAPPCIAIMRTINQGDDPMAEQEHLGILKQGVEVWNRWRGDHLKIRPNLRGIDFRHSSLKGADFRAVDLRGARFMEADLTKVDFYHADLSYANLTGWSVNS